MASDARKTSVENLFAHYGKVPNDVQLWTYTTEFDDLTDEEWRLLVREALRVSRWLPSIADLRKLADDAKWQVARNTARPKGEHECRLCEDTGFAYVNGDGAPVDFHTAVMEGVRKVAFCACRPTNASYKARVLAATVKGPKPKRPSQAVLDGD